MEMNDRQCSGEEREKCGSSQRRKKPNADIVESMRSKTNRIPVHFNIYKNAIFDQITEQNALSFS